LNPMKKFLVILFLLISGCAPLMDQEVPTSVPSNSSYYKGHDDDSYFGFAYQAPFSNGNTVLPENGNDAVGGGFIYGYWYKNHPWLGGRFHIFMDLTVPAGGAETYTQGTSQKVYSSFSWDILDLRLTSFGKWGYPYFFLGPSYEYIPTGAVGSVGGIGYNIPLIDSIGTEDKMIVDTVQSHSVVYLSIEDIEYWYPNGPMNLIGLRQNTTMNVLSIGIVFETFK